MKWRPREPEMTPRVSDCALRIYSVTGAWNLKCTGWGMMRNGTILAPIRCKILFPVDWNWSRLCPMHRYWDIAIFLPWVLGSCLCRLILFCTVVHNCALRFCARFSTIPMQNSISSRLRPVPSLSKLPFSRYSHFYILNPWFVAQFQCNITLHPTHRKAQRRLAYIEVPFRRKI